MDIIPLQRDSFTDHLLTPDNAAIVMIDYQPGLVEGTTSISRENLINNAVALAKVAKMYDMPTVVTTIAVEAGFQKPTLPEIMAELDVEPVDRAQVNAWESEAFRNAIKATGRKKIIMAALWTEVCLMYPALDMLKEGYEIYAVSDVSGGTTVDAHVRGMQRLMMAGAIPVTWEAIMAELGRVGEKGYSLEKFMGIMNDHLPGSLPGPLGS